jgi:hypothetical protein
VLSFIPLNCLGEKTSKRSDTQEANIRASELQVMSDK